MAKLRNLKKDIDFLVGQVVLDCFEYIHVAKDADSEGAYAIVGEILVFRNNLRNRVNHPDGKDNPALTKKFYHKIGQELVEACDESHDKLSKLVNG
ncbi:hypothetical protein [Mangrovibacterium lignilyticum]|uniref:hypothetical protein n=1 Tax=Mangrovibacterium lignilyticum TaxID=2668052 RepID=UPI0013CF9B9E|nr:hypothetical protein [Mangrovibacterium lignilyticum]